MRTWETPSCINTVATQLPQRSSSANRHKEMVAQAVFVHLVAQPPSRAAVSSSSCSIRQLLMLNTHTGQSGIANLFTVLTI